MSFSGFGKPVTRAALALALSTGVALCVLPGNVFAQDAGNAQTENANPDEVVATVDGIEITLRDLAIASADLTDIIQRLPPAQVQDYLVSFLVDMKLIARTAEADGLAEDKTFQRQIAFEREKALVQAKLRAVGEAATTEEALRAEYQEAFKDFVSEPEVRARHILVKTEDESKAIKEKIDGGASFEDMAKEHSTDGVSQNGGDLGYFKQGQMVKQFGDVAFAMDVGAISDPVETQFGWHLIKVEDKRDSKPPAFEEVEAEVRREVAQKARREYVVNLRETAEIERPGGDEAESEETDESKPTE